MSKMRFPKGWSEVKLKSENSILWSDATLCEDYKVISALVDDIVVGDSKHKSVCAEKIFFNIQTKTWQKNYPVRTFIFLIYYSLNYRITDLKTMSACQALDIIYFLKFGASEKDYFNEKIGGLYEEIYSKKLNPETAHIIRIIRNNVAHAGSIDGIVGKTRMRDRRRIAKFLSNNGLKNLRSIAYSLNLLVYDMVIRILGLELEDLSGNLIQPFENIYFKEKT